MTMSRQPMSPDPGISRVQAAEAAEAAGDAVDREYQNDLVTSHHELHRSNLWIARCETITSIGRWQNDPRQFHMTPKEAAYNFVAMYRKTMRSLTKTQIVS